MRSGEIVPYDQRRGELQRVAQDMLPQIEAAAPTGLDPRMATRNFMTALLANPELVECTNESLFLGLLVSTSMGLLIDSTAQHAHLVPFNDNRAGVVKAQLMFGWKGLRALCMRHPDVSHFNPPQVIYENDQFDIGLGCDPYLTHTRTLGHPRGKAIAYYTTMELHSGRKLFYVLERQDAEAIRDRIYAKRGRQPRPADNWHDYFDAMAGSKSTKYLAKFAPSVLDLDRAVTLDDVADAGIEQDLATVADSAGINIRQVREIAGPPRRLPQPAATGQASAQTQRQPQAPPPAPANETTTRGAPPPQASAAPPKRKRGRPRKTQPSPATEPPAAGADQQKADPEIAAARSYTEEETADLYEWAVDANGGEAEATQPLPKAESNPEPQQQTAKPVSRTPMEARNLIRDMHARMDLPDSIDAMRAAGLDTMADLSKINDMDRLREIWQAMDNVRRRVKAPEPDAGVI